VYKQIIKDLIDARDSLPSNFNRGHGERIIPNKAAATALLARTYLYAGDWKNADAQASLLISDTAFGLVQDLTQVFLKNSRETIWSLQPNPTIFPYGAFDVSNFVPFGSWASLGGDPSYLDPSGFSSIAFFVIPTYYLYKTTGNAFEPGDQRKAIWTSYTPTPNALPYTGDTLFYSIKYPTRPSAGSITQYYMVFRLAEQYLIRAEAKAQEGDLTGGTADVNSIRSRAGLPPVTPASQSDLLGAIMQERRVELFTEWGHRFFDLKRTGQANAVIGAMPEKQPWHGNQLLYPIPFNEIKTDPNLVQNPGY
ncbi:MAG TPA: RagB/SusD family nutrient uptake outer membrane protein, partial [Puia sp.]|nr:RagB/SusD family nutrient uptake outer membrane protein [Puia sp.]